MTHARFDGAVWSGVERRLADVERFIPETPSWRPAGVPEVAGAIRLGSAFGRPSARVGRRRSRLVLALVVIGALLALIVSALIIGGPRPSELDSRFGPLGALRVSDAGANAALLPDGRVLIVSGEWIRMEGNVGPRVATWDAAGGLQFLGPPIQGRVNPTVTLLLDGRVLAVGGFAGPYQYASTALASAEIWDPATGLWTATGSMANARVHHTATLLLDGRVLVAGGTGRDGTVKHAEVWDPASGGFHVAGVLPGRAGHTSTLLPDGTVLVMGGGGLGQLWRPAYENFTSAGGWLDQWQSMTATRLSDGRVVFVGGLDHVPRSRLEDVYIRNPGADSTFRLLDRPRSRHAAALLPDGRVLVLGGATPDGNAIAAVDAIDPTTGDIAPMPPLDRPVADHAALTMPDGLVLIVPDWSGPDGVLEPFLYEPEAMP